MRNRARATQPTTTNGNDEGRTARSGARSSSCSEHDQVATLATTDGRADASNPGPDHGGSGGEAESVVHRLREERVPLRNESSDRRRGHTQAADPAAEVTGQEVGEHHAGSGEGDICQAHEHQPAVGTIGGVGQPDQRRRGEVVERRMVGDPYVAVTVVPSRLPLRLPLHRTVRDVRWLGDLGKIEVGDLVGVPEVGSLVGGNERRLLEGEQQRRCPRTRRRLRSARSPWSNESRVDDNEEQVATAGDLTVGSADERATAPLAGPRRHPGQLDVQPQRVPGDDLASEAGGVEATEQRQLAGEALIGQHGDGADLGDRLAHQHARQRRPAREVSGEEPLLTGEPPRSSRSGPRLQSDDLVDEQERWTMREHVGWLRHGAVAHDARAASRFFGVSAGLTLYHASAILPDSSTRKADRSMPM